MGLDADELRRYARHLVIPEVGMEGQERLRDASVLLVGCGGLGSPLALYLAAAGIGTLGLVEYDTVDESNLQRQVLFGQSDLGRPKLEVAVERLREVNPLIEVVAHPLRLGIDNALELVGAYDMVADGSDNFATRYLVNDACVLTGRPDVYGSIFRFEGQLSVFWAQRGPCYRCLFPEPPPPGLVPSCAEGGVLGVLPGIIGALQANEVIKLALGVGEPMIGRFAIFDALGTRFRELELAKSPDCPVCSEEPSQRGLVDYGQVCADEPAAVEHASIGERLETTPREVVEWREAGRPHALLDVREPVEHSICRIEGAALIPLRELPGRLDELDPEKPLVVYCHTGVRSLHAVHLLRDRGFPESVSMAGGIDAWSREIDPSVPRY